MISCEVKSIAEMFALQVKKQPGAAAVNFDRRQISYRELSQKADGIAGELIKCKIGPGAITALYLRSYVDFIAGILGIIKAGACCLPLHHSWPPDSINRILQYSGPGYLLADKNHTKTIAFKGKILALNSPGNKDETQRGSSSGTDSHRPMAVIYSPNFIGKPEGVTLSYKYIREWIIFNLEKLKIDFSQTLFISSSRMEIAFPIWLASLVSGGNIYFYRQKDDRDIFELMNLMKEKNFKSVISPLYFLQNLIRGNHFKNFFPANIANIVSLGEETFDADEFKRFLKEKKIRWHNYYGFPEMGIVTIITADNTNRGRGEKYKHTGIPAAGTKAYILDGAGKLATSGVNGELYVCGSGVMSRYHKNEELNRSHFVKPAAVPHSNIYKTGYRAFWLTDGKISIRGRTDNRVHIGGNRITLEEIEYLLCRHPAVVDCAVTLKQTAEGTVKPGAYIVLKEEIAAESIESDLKKYLTPGVFPPGFMKVSAIPRKDNGTVDREYLKRMDYMDNHQIRELEEQLQNEPGIDRAAVTAGEKIDVIPPLHVKDFLAPVTPGTLNKKGMPSASSTYYHGASGKRPGENPDKIPLALIEGEELQKESGDPETLADALERAALQNGENGIFYIHPDGSGYFQCYTALLEEAERVLAGLRHTGINPGDKILFQFNRDQDYTAAFWGSELGGMVPVPITVPRSFNQPGNETAVLYNVWETLGRPIILTAESLKESLTLLSGHYDFDPSRIVTIETLRQHEPDRERYRGSADDLALLLFTSGSTGVPKGVMQTHRTILAREKATIRHNDFNSRDVSMNWMPLEHVGGVVMFHVRDVYCCCNQIQVRTEYILSSPLRWLELIEKHGVTITWAPNFAFGLVNEQMEQERVAGIKRQRDLSSMKFILNGGEAINAATVKRFLKSLAPFGLSAHAIKPAWGMSETCSGVVYSHALTADPDTGIHHLDKHSLAGVIEKCTPGVGSVTFVELGSTIPGISLRVADPENRVVREGKVGRLQIKGTTVTVGYYNNPALNREVFTPDGWFDTGDLGFILKGKMTITGRAKDVIIINGVNYNNIEIESIVEEVEGVETSYTAACAARDPHSDTERVIIFYSSAYTGPDRKLVQIRNIKKRLVEKMGIKPDLVLPVAREEIPRTSIGKIQRLKLGKLFENGYFDDIVKQVDIGLENENTLPQWFFERNWYPRPVLFLEEDMRGHYCLVFEDDMGLADTLIRKLEEHHCQCLKIKTVLHDNEFSSGGDENNQKFLRGGARGRQEIKIDAREPADYKSLFEEVFKRNDERIQVLDIFHPGSYDFSREENHVSSKGIYSLLYLIRALEGTARSIRLFVVGNQVQLTAPSDKIVLEKTVIPGILKTAALELSWLSCCCIDLEPGPVHTGVENIINEWKNPKSTDVEVAYRGGRRLVPLLRRVPVSAGTIGRNPLKRGGVYLVTGGLGGIGCYVSKWLMAEYGIKLIIVGRTTLPQREQWGKHLEENTAVSKRLRSYLDIERVHGDFIYGAGDVSDETFLNRLTARAEKKWGQPLSGIFHLAGKGNLEYHWTVMEKHRVTVETPQTFEDMYRTKVYGTLALHRLVKENPGALFVGFSSTAAIFGAATFSAYAAANSFLDSFCQYRRNNGYPNTYCLNWSSWDNVGMSENNAPHMVKAMLLQGYRGIDPQQGLYSLLLALSSRQSRLIIGLDGTNRNIRKHLVDYPSDRQELHIYYTLKKEADFSDIRFHRRVSDLLATRNKSTAVFHHLDTMPLLVPSARRAIKSFDQTFSKGGWHPQPIRPPALIPPHVVGPPEAIDYHRLETMEKRPGDSGGQFDMPQTPTEKALARIWQELLGKARVGVNDNFFELGGHSLKATIMISQVHKELDVNLSLGDIFMYPTIGGISQFIDSSSLSGDKYEAVRPLEAKEYYELSSAQKRLYILNHLDPKSTSYNIAEARQLEGNLDWKKLEQAFKKLIARHESFRTYFVIRGELPIQAIANKVHFKIDRHDMTAGEGDRAVQVKALIKSFEKPFILSHPPLLRARLIKTGETKHILLVDTHHIVSDGLSHGIFINELKALYTGVELPLVRIQYKAFALWQNRQLRSGEMKQQQDYWLKQFEGEIPVLDIPIDYSRPRVQDFTGKSLRFTIEREETLALKQVASTENVTLNMVLLAIYNIFLSKLSGQEDIVIGTATAGRRHADLGQIVGMFVDTLAVRNYPVQTRTFVTFLKEVKQHLLQALENQDYQFEELVDKLEINRDMSRNPLFDVMFVFENLDVFSAKIPGIDIPGLEIKPYEYETVISMFDMTMAVEENQSKEILKVYLEYSTRLFKPGTIERFIYYFKRIISAIPKNQHRKISDLEIISLEEKTKILYDFNDTQTDYPGGKTIHRLFEEQVEKTPDCVALIGEIPNQLTYRELNKKSSQLAGLLKEKSVQPDSIVGIMIENSIEMIIGILGILKAGGAYLPIDPDYPEERINYMLMDSKVNILVKNSNNISNSTYGQELFVLNFEHLNFEFLRGCPRRGLSGFDIRISDLEPSNLAYVIYTSGSTGKPKGVMLDHHSAVNILFSLFDHYPLSGTGGYLLKTPFIFDVSISELFGWIPGGSRLVILGKNKHKDPREILEAIEYSKITHINFVPSMFNVFVDRLNHGNIVKLSGLKYIFLAGETLLPQQVNKFRNLKTKIILENLYGPTEAAVYSSKFSLSQWQGGAKIPIGKPLQNTRLYILDKGAHIQPVGVPGELCISGAGIARGYLNRPGLTNEKFCLRRPGGRFLKKLPPWTPRKNFLLKEAVNNHHPHYPITPLPHSPHSPHSPIYRTGDLARWLPDGNVEFLGRMDYQVKVRGFRIELGEIESQLLKHKDIAGAVVTAVTHDTKPHLESDENNQYLCAYITPSGVPGKTPGTAELKLYLSHTLPDYMIPSFFVSLEKVPLTPGGKIDRKALPEPGVERTGKYTAPRDDIERRLVTMWSRVLRIEPGIIGIENNFFHLGGHSLRGTVLAARIEKEFNAAYPLSALFRAPFIRAAANTIKQAKRQIYSPLESVERKEYYPVSPIQKRLFIVHQLEGIGTAYNLVDAFIMEGPLDRQRLEQAFLQLIKRHESLRTSFHIVDGQPVQKIQEDFDFEFEYFDSKIDLVEVEVKVKAERKWQLPTSIINDFSRPFDFSRAPLLRVRLVRLAEDENSRLLLVDIHHIVTDGTSRSIFYRDLLAFYENRQLTGLSLQYKDFSQWQTRGKHKTGLESQEQYWLHRFKEKPPDSDIFTDFPRPPLQSFAGEVLSFTLEQKLMEKIDRLTKETGTTLFMVLLAVYSILLSKYTGQEDITVGTPVAGREHADLENLIGLFINALPMRNYPRRELTFAEFLGKVKENTLNAFENQGYPFDYLLEKLDIKVDMGRNPIFDVELVLLNMEQPRLETNRLTFTPCGYELHVTQVDLALYGIESEKEIELNLFYCTALFKRSTMERFINYFKEILWIVVEDRNIKLKDIHISYSFEETKSDVYNDIEADLEF